ncbi:RbsD/FucU family protein [Alkalihalobacillus sp. TS-13]|uniref:RbsD/FucU family protein n=1 Tax=Alkalihalobacillus sp. TS-13 TaxID=2842455 RepID=UPI001C88B75C|nr:RbsD/FucU family protein [Alkalihalobacillus sp. TS-13]
MLKTNCLHPELLYFLARSGHGDRILISDGNYPAETKTNPNCTKIYLNLAPGLLTAIDVIKVLNNTIPIELACVMLPDEDVHIPIYSEFYEIINQDLEKKSRFEFYNECKSEDVKLTIVTGEQRTYANLLLTIGVVN